MLAKSQRQNKTCTCHWTLWWCLCMYLHQVTWAQ